MPRNHPGAKASHEVLGHPRDIHLVTLWVKKGKNSYAIGLDVSTRSRWDLSGGLDGATAPECLKLRGSRQCEPARRNKKAMVFRPSPLGFLVASQGLEPRTQGL